MKSKELLLKHLDLNDCKGYITSDGRLYKAIIDALDEALITYDVSKCTCDTPSNQTHFKDGKVVWTCFKCKKPS